MRSAGSRIARFAVFSGIALQLFNKILESNPGYYDAVVGKAYTLLWMGQREQARVLFSAARNRDPGDKEIAAVLKSLAGAPVAKPKPSAPAIAKAEGSEARMVAYRQRLSVDDPVDGAETAVVHHGFAAIRYTEFRALSDETAISAG